MKQIATSTIIILLFSDIDHSPVNSLQFQANHKQRTQSSYHRGRPRRSIDLKSYQLKAYPNFIKNKRESFGSQRQSSPYSQRNQRMRLRGRQRSNSKTLLRILDEPNHLTSPYITDLYGPSNRSRPHDNQLVYYEEVPDNMFCERDPGHHILGTKDRVCNSTSQGPDNCRQLCCQRGFLTHHYYAMESCNCKFIWCCRVQCQQCLVLKTVETCV